MEKTPQLSICIPSYNYGHYLGQAIDSCLASASDFRLVVLDNASTDGTPLLRERYVQDPRVSWFRNEQLLGIQDNWNRAVELCRTPWVKLLQADDMLLPGAIERMEQIITLRPEDSFHAHLCSIMDEHGKIYRHQRPYTKNHRPLHLTPKEALSLKLEQVARLKEPTSNLFTKEAWQAVGGYPRDTRFTFDLAFNVQLMARYSGTLWSEYIACVRRHPGSDGSRLPAQKALDDMRLLHERILLLDPSPRNKRLAEGACLYRSIELIGQRWRKRPAECAKYIFKNFRVFLNLGSWPGALGTVWRKIRTGDVQKTID